MEKEFIQYCLTQKGSYVDFPFGDSTLCIKVRKKLIAQFFEQKGESKVTLKCTPDFGDFMKQAYPAAITRGYHCPPVQQPYFITASVDQLAANILLDMIDHSYDTVVGKLPKKVQAKLREGSDLDSLPYQAVFLDITDWHQAKLCKDFRYFFERCPLPVCIVSELRRENLQAALTALNLNPDHLFAIDRSSCCKSIKELLLLALRTLSLTPEQILLMGDSWRTGIPEAAGLGIDVVWINRNSEEAIDPNIKTASNLLHGLRFVKCPDPISI